MEPFNAGQAIRGLFALFKDMVLGPSEKENKCNPGATDIKHVVCVVR